MGLLQHECGVFAAYVPGGDAASVAYRGISKLQHRGQDEAGIRVVDDTGGVSGRVGEGSIAEVFDDGRMVASWSGSMAVAHNRYPTSGPKGVSYPQPILGEHCVVAHNGTLAYLPPLRDFLLDLGVCPEEIAQLNDSHMMAKGIDVLMAKGLNLRHAFEVVYADEKLFGGLAVVAAAKEEMLAARGNIRPLVMGEFPTGGFAFGSETRAFAGMGVANVRDIGCGELVHIHKGGVDREVFDPRVEPLDDIFELVYFGKPDSVYRGMSIGGVRCGWGWQLATEQPVQADLVVPVLGTGREYAHGYSLKSGIPYNENALVRVSGKRSFIEKDTEKRQGVIGKKFVPNPELLSGSRVVLVDDSGVRGNTLGPIVKSVRSAGAAEVHVRIGSPMVIGRDYFGVDVVTDEELIANQMNLEQMCGHFGADSLGFLSVEGMLQMVGGREGWYTGMFDRNYPKRRDNIDYRV